MPFSLHFGRPLSIVDHGYKPVPVVPDIKDHVAIYGICILEYFASLLNIVPANRFDDGFPGSDFVSRIGIFFHRLLQMLNRDDVHRGYSTSQYVKSSSGLGETEVTDRHRHGAACQQNSCSEDKAKLLESGNYL